jgi:hypothetical protein
MTLLWGAALFDLTNVKTAAATLDCEEFPEYCDPTPTCSNAECREPDSSFCTALSSHRCAFTFNPLHCTTSSC